MTTINMKDFYYWYIVDELVEVPDEVAEVLLASRRNEAAYQRRLTRNKAFSFPQRLLWFPWRSEHPFPHTKCG